MTAEDAYAAAFLSGSEHVDVRPPSIPQEYLLQQALDRSTGTSQMQSFNDLRSIVLEDYQDVTDPSSAALLEVSEAEAVESAVAAGEEAAAADEDNLPVLAEPAPTWKAWLKARTPVEKFLLIEAAVVAAVLVLVALPLFIFMIFRGPSQSAANTSQTAQSPLVPRPLPTNLPRPVGLTLEGGWYFSLARSTFVDGQWKPKAGEWLEGTELRRVVALPWNPQTEAVIHSFKVGDPIQVRLSNQETMIYKVQSVERVPVNNTAIFTDSKPSLAIVLYQEKAEERWVVLCKP